MSLKLPAGQLSKAFLAMGFKPIAIWQRMQQPCSQEGI